MTKWNEVDIEMFREIFDMYWNKHPGTEDKVLEIQSLRAIKEKAPEVRVYLGSGIFIEDFRDSNQESLKFIEGLRKTFGPEFMRAHISLCLLTSGPKVIPIGKSKEHYNLIWNSWFGDSSEEVNNSSGIELLKPVILWYTKNAGKYILGNYNTPNIPLSERKIRLRGWFLGDWKQRMYDYGNLGSCVLDMEDDVREEEILEP